MRFDELCSFDEMKKGKECPMCSCMAQREFTPLRTLHPYEYRSPICGSLGEKILEHRDFKNEGLWDNAKEFLR